LPSFMKGLDIKERHDGDVMFNVLKNKSDKVEWLAVLAAMILMSNQKYISKVTFLFSLCDFDGSGTINCAELCIGMRYLFLGISRFFKNAMLPPRADVENAAIAAFGKMDADHSSSVTISEVVSFSYMSKNMRMLLSPFPATDDRIFEELIQFDRRKASQRGLAEDQLRKQEQEDDKQPAADPRRRSQWW